jgi:hypothetical protein
MVNLCLYFTANRAAISEGKNRLGEATVYAEESSWAVGILVAGLKGSEADMLLFIS